MFQNLFHNFQNYMGEIYDFMALVICKVNAYKDLPYVPVWPGLSRFKHLS